MSEIEAAVGELETRLDRLRALYDQYFMGIERLEPLVPKKDVERRFIALRKEQIKNTGLRFKFQTLTQRYNTYQTYWIRIARQIENGTYRRDIMRAQAKFGVDPTTERAVEPPAEQAKPARRAEAPSESAGVYIPEEEIQEIEEIQQDGGGSAFLQALDIDDDPFAGIIAPAEEKPVPRERFASSVQLDIERMSDPVEEEDPFPKARPPASGPKIRPRGAPASEPQAEAHDTDRKIPVAASVRIAPRPPGAPPSFIIAKRAAAPEPTDAPPPSSTAFAPPGARIRRRDDPATLTSEGGANLQAEIQRRMTLQGTGTGGGGPSTGPARAGAGAPPRRRDDPTLTSEGAAGLQAEIQRRTTLPHGAGSLGQTSPVIVTMPQSPAAAPATGGLPPSAIVAPAPVAPRTTVSGIGGAPPSPRVVQKPPTLSGGQIPSVQKPPTLSGGQIPSVQKPPTLSGGQVPSVQKPPTLSGGQVPSVQKPPTLSSGQIPSVQKPPTLSGGQVPSVQRPPTLSGGQIPSGGAPASPAQRPPVPSSGAAARPEIQRAPISAPRGPAVPPSSPQPAASAPAVARAAASPPAVSKPAGDLTGQRVDEIYSKYVETRRAQNEPTHAITRDALAKQLSDSIDKLKQKHGAKPIDFEVVVKDGRTILKPVLK
jgi:hypothetical protein